MLFSEQQFPTDISFSSSGGPSYYTDIISTQNGFEQRNINWHTSRAEYNISHSIKTQEQLDNLIIFFREHRGRAIGFRFKDWIDYKMISHKFAITDGITKQFQIIKQYGSSNNPYKRIIHKPVQNSVTIYINTTKTQDIRSTFAQNAIDYTTGIITFAAPPPLGAQLTIDCEFDVPVRFNTDHLSASLESYGIFSWNDIKLVEIRI